jgi:SAM-dependent methyltransferase
MRFEDHFSHGAGDYARFRPRHPSALFAYLASIAPGHSLAWDCATGNGQAALALAEHFDRVVATDASPEQVAHAFRHERVTYRVEAAEEPSLDASSVDVVTVAAAMHWFDFERFFSAVRRVLRPGGVIAAWTYYLPQIEPLLDRLLRTYGKDVLAGCWPERFHYVAEEYRTLPFPFAEFDAPPFEMEAHWDLDHLIGFLDSWSATRPHQRRHGRHPAEAIRDDLRAAWGAPDRRRTLRWPISLRVGRSIAAESRDR